MYGRRVLEGVETPAFIVHLVRDVIDAKFGRLEGDDHGDGVATQFNVFHILHGSLNLALCFHDLLGVFEKALLAHGDQTSPARSRETARPGSSGRWGHIESTGPGWVCKVLVAAKLMITVQDHGCSFCGVSVLVRVHGHRGHAVQFKVKLWDGIPKLLSKGQHIPTEATVNMETTVVCLCNFRELFDRVDDAMRVLWRAGVNHDGVRCNVFAQNAWLHSMGMRVNGD
mmetsp:Transcript_13796/g.24655  ORF Transcript_13796/g.24655 Transcript_13796/m.24655 type:complete len:227 (-) Transcript_13796:424-1104(-)